MNCVCNCRHNLTFETFTIASNTRKVKVRVDVQVQNQKSWSLKNTIRENINLWHVALLYELPLLVLLKLRANSFIDMQRQHRVMCQCRAGQCKIPGKERRRGNVVFLSELFPFLPRFTQPCTLSIRCAIDSVLEFYILCSKCGSFYQPCFHQLWGWKPCWLPASHAMPSLPHQMCQAFYLACDSL